MQMILNFIKRNGSKSDCSNPHFNKPALSFSKNIRGACLSPLKHFRSFRTRYMPDLGPRSCGDYCLCKVNLGGCIFILTCSPFLL